MSFEQNTEKLCNVDDVNGSYGASVVASVMKLSRRSAA